jgi:hypothetical protein
VFEHPHPRAAVRAAKALKKFRESRHADFVVGSLLALTAALFGLSSPGTLFGWYLNGPQEVAMKTAAIGAIGLLVLAGGLFTGGAASFSARGADVRNTEFIGEITDSYCAENGHHIGATKGNLNTAKAVCTRACVKFEGAQFVLFDKRMERTYKLDDQEQPDAFAGQKVIVSGTYDSGTQTIHVRKIRPLTESGH